MEGHVYQESIKNNKYVHTMNKAVIYDGVVTTQNYYLNYRRQYWHSCCYRKLTDTFSPSDITMFQYPKIYLKFYLGENIGIYVSKSCSVKTGGQKMVLK